MAGGSAAVHLSAVPGLPVTGFPVERASVAPGPTDPDGGVR